jgi:pyruvate/2-oxoglutarate dehydrogenase complex dihydrolipoamide dehydrogenase (E3) component
MDTANSQPENYDAVVLGSGEAGKYLAWTTARKGLRTILVERKYIGGSCPNIACLPSKNIVHSAKVASYFWRSEEFGITKENTRIHMPAVRERKRKMVDGLVEMHLGIFKSSGAELLHGSGRFIQPKRIEVTLPDGGTRVLCGENVVISTGSRARIDPISGLAEAQPLTHIEALELDHVPRHLLVMGGGYIGLELAQAMRRFGSAVTVIDRNPRVLHREDQDITGMLHEFLRTEGIDILTDTRITHVEGRSGEWVKLHASRGVEEFTVEGTHILMATGRTPNTDGIGLELAGVEMTAAGFVKVNERLQTTAPGVWAVGDCAGSPHFTHIAFDDFRIVRDNLFGQHRVTTGRQVPFCVFTDPEFARIGLSETEARAQGIPYRLAKVLMASVLRTRTLSETHGFMKALIDTESDRILGFAALGVGADDLVAVIQVAMQAGMPYTTLRDTIFTHPTMAEGLIALFANAPQRPS